jgi:DNA repair exonuclease SbcCD ATPase subunit
VDAKDREVVTKAERDAQSVLIDEQRRLLAEKQTEIGALEAERDDLRKIVEMVHADLGIQRGDHVGEAISELKKEASDATARQRMTEVRALKYSAQAEDARREIERLRSEVESLRAKLNAKTVEWPEWAKVGARVRVRSNDCMTTQNSDRVVGEELVIAKVRP